MISTQTQESSGVAGKIRVAVHDTDELTETIDDWEQLSRYERWLALRDPDEFDVDDLDADRTLEGADRELTRERIEALLAVEPPTPDVEKTTNTTVDALHEYFVDELDPSQTVDLEASHLAVGTDGATGTNTGDTSLNNEVYRTSITDSIDNGKDLLSSTFLDSSEANGNTIDEVGLFSSDTGGTMLNHATITAITKDSSKTATIDVTLEFRAA